MPNKSSFPTIEDWREYYRRYRATHRKKFREYNRKYNKAWRAKNGYHNETKWQENNPEKYKAQQMLRYAVKKKMIEKLPCLICGNKRSGGHHFDYTKPLEVIWLCALHHKEVHKNPIWQKVENFERVAINKNLKGGVEK